MVKERVLFVNQFGVSERRLAASPLATVPLHAHLLRLHLCQRLSSILTYFLFASITATPPRVPFPSCSRPPPLPLLLLLPPRRQHGSALRRPTPSPLPALSDCLPFRRGGVFRVGGGALGVVEWLCWRVGGRRESGAAVLGEEGGDCGEAGVRTVVDGGWRGEVRSGGVFGFL